MTAQEQIQAINRINRAEIWPGVGIDPTNLAHREWASQVDDAGRDIEALIVLAESAPNESTRAFVAGLIDGMR